MYLFGYLRGFCLFVFGESWLFTQIVLVFYILIVCFWDNIKIYDGYSGTCNFNFMLRSPLLFFYLWIHIYIVSYKWWVNVRCLMFYDHFLRLFLDLFISTKGTSTWLLELFTVKRCLTICPNGVKDSFKVVLKNIYICSY